MNSHQDVKIEHTLNSRSYSSQLNIAEKSLILLEKIREREKHIEQNNFNIQIENLDIENIFFQLSELHMISIDYTFSAYENFLEHIGFILIDEWDSQKKERHYQEKRKKLISLKEIIEKQNIPNCDLKALSKLWCETIESFNVDDYFIKTRNRIKHTHADRDDIKIKFSVSDYYDSEQEIFNDTYLDITNDKCEIFYKNVKDFINKVHIYIKNNQILFPLNYRDVDKKEKKKQLFQTFLNNPFTQTMLIKTKSFER